MYRHAAGIFFIVVCIGCAAMMGLTGYRLATTSSKCKEIRRMAAELEPAMKTLPGPPAEAPKKQIEINRRVIAAWEQVPESRDFSFIILSQ
ncbi:MAG TPA: hypothetical protein PL033_17290 [Candidatus Brocadiia bacterium]|nr:hypothetical protein [Candidatus Brocadiia bacterium]